jgi:hypothetical protein
LPNRTSLLQKVVIPGGHWAPAGCSSWASVGQAVPLDRDTTFRTIHPEPRGLRRGAAEKQPAARARIRSLAWPLHVEARCPMALPIVFPSQASSDKPPNPIDRRRPSIEVSRVRSSLTYSGPSLVLAALRLLRVFLRQYASSARLASPAAGLGICQRTSDSGHFYRGAPSVNWVRWFI